MKNNLSLFLPFFCNKLIYICFNQRNEIIPLDKINYNYLFYVIFAYLLTFLYIKYKIFT